MDTWIDICRYRINGCPRYPSMYLCTHPSICPFIYLYRYIDKYFPPPLTWSHSSKCGCPPSDIATNYIHIGLLCSHSHGESIRILSPGPTPLNPAGPPPILPPTLPPAQRSPPLPQPRLGRSRF